MGILGDEIKDFKQLDAMIENLKRDYDGSSYHLLNKYVKYLSYCFYCLCCESFLFTFFA
jgi:hypothetical protein